MAQVQARPLNLNDLCCEAVAQFGDDFERIEQYVTDRLSQLPRDSREALLRDVLAILRYEPPLARDMTRM